MKYEWMLWCPKTRELRDVGPFKSRKAAKKAMVKNDDGHSDQPVRVVAERRRIGFRCQ